MGYMINAGRQSRPDRPSLTLPPSSIHRTPPGRTGIPFRILGFEEATHALMWAAHAKT